MTMKREREDEDIARRNMTHFPTTNLSFGTHPNGPDDDARQDNANHDDSFISLRMHDEEHSTWRGWLRGPKKKKWTREDLIQADRNERMGEGQETNLQEEQDPMSQPVTHRPRLDEPEVKLEDSFQHSTQPVAKPKARKSRRAEKRARREQKARLQQERAANLGIKTKNDEGGYAQFNRLNRSQSPVPSAPTHYRHRSPLQVTPRIRPTNRYNRARSMIDMFMALDKDGDQQGTRSVIALAERDFGWTICSGKDLLDRLSRELDNGEDNAGTGRSSHGHSQSSGHRNRHSRSPAPSPPRARTPAPPLWTLSQPPEEIAQLTPQTISSIKRHERAQTILDALEAMNQIGDRAGHDAMVAFVLLDFGWQARSRGEVINRLQQELLKHERPKNPRDQNRGNGSAEYGDNGSAPQGSDSRGYQDHGRVQVEETNKMEFEYE